ncbi:MAG: hypothetical protein WCK29_01330 [archaeon]
MKYTVNFHDRVSDSVFIYHIKENTLKGCDAVIRTNYDPEIDKDDKNLDFNKIEFRVETKFFGSQPTENLEEKLKVVEKTQRKRNWNCIRLEDGDEFDYAIQYHLREYKESVKNRLLIARAKVITGETK